ncbi:MAG TPA: ABATE domain-containing protein [Candidatus Acidoferrales bacterium]|nr:ABATE domain-containing protein [Candidatus Acidoferrales bacterium]
MPSKHSAALPFAKRPAGTVNLIGGRLSLDFVNTVGARRIGPSGQMLIRDEKLNDYFDLLAWARHADALTEAQVRRLGNMARAQFRRAKDTLRDALHLRESLYRLFKAVLHHRCVPEDDLAILNQTLDEACRRHVRTSGASFEWSGIERALSLRTILWMVGESAAEFLTTGDLSRLSQCGGDDCGWLFEDITRNHSRRWCDTRDCGNRDRVRRFRSHHSPLRNTPVIRQASAQLRSS